MASNAKNLAEYLNNETTSATADIADNSITYPKTSFADSATGAQTLPKGTTAQRPGSAANGMVRYNTTNDVTEEYRDGAWHNLSNLVTTSGGTVTSAGGYTIHTFTSSGTFQVVGGNKAGVDYMVLAGGGGGGSTRAGGGGVNGTNGYRCCGCWCWCCCCCCRC